MIPRKVTDDYIEIIDCPHCGRHVLAYDPSLGKRNMPVCYNCALKWLDERGYAIALYDSKINELQFTQTPWEQSAHDVLAISRTSTESVFERLQGSN